MSVFNILSLKIIVFIPFVLSQSTTDLPSHICAFLGEMNIELTENYKFGMADLPKRCEVALYGCYYIGKTDLDDKTMYKQDEDAIRTLVTAKIPVYIYVSYDEKLTWSHIFDPKTEDEYNNLMCPLMQKINDLGISGIIFCTGSLLDDGISDYPNKIKTTISKIKEKIPTLKVGLNVYIDELSKNIKAFDFSITNSAVDLYNINMYVRNDLCDDIILQNGTPIKSANTNDDTLESRSNVISSLGMDKNKTFANIQVAVLVPVNDGTYPTLYSEYCSDVNAAVSCTWCADSTQHLYDEGVFLKTKFHGVMASVIDLDDTLGVCQCQICPATNALFDGFDGVVHKGCPKIDKRS